ncbi:MAG: GGDEF domain-containing protein [Fimbriimonadaceae bacterium]|nr:GGDEF domain-containing protein [Fimbriimonadaceae bacterium]QYK56851.1 MAG: GGDEF domain-containing protein [Fimbriimonadaceae bacterium]
MGLPIEILAWICAASPSRLWVVDSLGEPCYQNQQAEEMGAAMWPAFRQAICLALGFKDWQSLASEECGKPIGATIADPLGSSVRYESLVLTIPGDPVQVLVWILPTSGAEKAARPPLEGPDLTDLQSELVVRAMQYQEMYLREEKLAHTDGLTGVLNRRALVNRLERSLAEAGFAGEPVSFILLDIDHFKRLNDTFGHQTGDQALKGMGVLMKERVRDIDYVGRMGGEEFGVVLPHIPAPAAVNVANRLRAAIEGAELCCTPFTASFGVATTVDGKATADEIYNQADKALYASKHGGRNRVTHFGDLPAESADAPAA